MMEILVSGKQFGTQNMSSCSNPKVIFTHIARSQPLGKRLSLQFALTKSINFGISHKQIVAIDGNNQKAAKRFYKLLNSFVAPIALQSQGMKFANSYG